MSRVEKAVFFTVLAVLAVALTFMSIQSLAKPAAGRVYRVSVLLDGSDEEYWKNFRLGAEQAAQENNVDVRYISRYEGDAALGQVDALRQEWESQADGVVVVPVDADALSLALMEAPQQLKVTVSGAKLVTERPFATVSADNRTLGARLAEAVADSGVKACTVFVPYASGAAVNERYEGFAARLEELGVSHGKVETADPERAPLSPGLALAALDPATAEGLCRQKDAAGRVYGIGSSGRLLRYLEDGAAAALVVRSDYAAGYLSLTRTLGTLRGRPAEDVTLDAYTVTKDNMFEEPLVHLLFPVP